MPLPPAPIGSTRIHRVMPSVKATEDVFTPQDEARRELKRRRKDADLQAEVREFIDTKAKKVLEKCEVPRAVMFRQLASPTHELLRFLRIAKHMHLTPLLFEYHGDKFVSANNSYKRALGKMPIYQHTGIDGRDIVRYKNIIDFNTSAGKPLDTIRCRDGQSLIGFHHKLLKKMARLNVEAHSVDATPWFRGIGGNAIGYYEQFLSLFIRDGILFEQFEPTKSEQRFTREVVMPAFKRVLTRFKLRPLIVRVVPKNKEGLSFWDSYPTRIEKFLEESKRRRDTT